MNIKEIGEFYKDFVTSEYFTKELQEKLKSIQDELDYKSFISEYVIPKAIEKGYDFSVDDIMRYENIMLDSLSEEDIANVAGGRLDRLEKGAFVPGLMLAFNNGLIGN